MINKKEIWNPIFVFMVLGMLAAAVAIIGGGAWLIYWCIQHVRFV